MGSGDIVVGKKSASERSENSEGAVTPAPTQAIPGTGERHCGAMSQQRSDSGMVSTPQKLVRLVGCRDPKARPPGSR